MDWLNLTCNLRSKVTNKCSFSQIGNAWVSDLCNVLACLWLLSCSDSGPACAAMPASDGTQDTLAPRSSNRSSAIGQGTESCASTVGGADLGLELHSGDGIVANNLMCLFNTWEIST